MQVFANKEKLGKMTQTGNTTVQLSSSTVTLGAKQFSTGNLTCDITTSGAGGLDTGSEQSGKYYYVYLVNNSGTAALVCSLSEQKPSGFTKYKKVGAFVNNYSGDIEQPLNIGEQPYSEVMVDEVIGSGSTNNRFGRFQTLISQKGIEIQWIQSASDGDKFQLGKSGVYSAHCSLADTFGSGQEVGISINSDAFGTTNLGSVVASNPELIMCNTRSSTTVNHVKACSNKRFLQANSYLRAHSQGDNVFAAIVEPFLSVQKEGSNEIDWTDY